MEKSRRRCGNLRLSRDPVRIGASRLRVKAGDCGERVCGANKPARHGSEAILNEFLGALKSHAPGCTRPELRSLQQSLLDVMSAFLAQGPESSETPRADSGGGGAGGGAGRATLREIRSFIETRLADHDLTPQTVADHHHISLSTLYALFRDQEEEGVAAWIRRRRLERSRADLAVVNRRQQPIHAIAVRWGFTDGAAFSRAFRQAYGMSPRAFRQRAGARDT